MTVARQLEEHAEHCLKLAYQCRTRHAERVLRMLAVDLMLASEQLQRDDLAAQFAALRESETAKVPA